MNRGHLRAGRKATGGLVALVLALAPLAGCKDRIADPTQGFIEVRTGDVSGTEVFVNGESRGTAGRIGPLDAGTYTVSVVRECYHVAPFSRDVEVRPGRTTSAEFALELGDAGSIHAAALDEILGTAVNGAQILLDTGGGLQPTGVVTPGTLDRVPCGDVRVALRAAGYADSDPVTVTVIPFETAEVDVELGPPRAVLAEMFTYVYCPNCPRAAEELKGIQQADPSRFYVVEWHRTASLPLYDARWNERESFYGTVSGWPAVVIHGGSDPSHDPEVMIGSDASELAAYHTRAEDYAGLCDNDCPVALKVTGSISASGADATVHVLYRGGPLPAGLVLTILLTENHVLAPGNQPEGFDYVARDIFRSSVSFPTAGETSVFTHSFPVPTGGTPPGTPAGNPENLHITAWIQSDASHEVLAVGGI